jgi:cytochrome c-type biogenesis protein CcmH
MTIWILFALMTGAAVMAALWPLSRRPALARAAEADTVFYRDQIAEIERDLDRGLISAREAEAAKAEAGRRLLRAASETEQAAPDEGEPALRRRRAASALALSIIPLCALAVYGAYGSPALPAKPLASRIESDPARIDLAQAVAQIEAHLAQNPGDGRGWEVIAPVYMRSGRYDDAAKAFEAAIRASGPSPDRLANLGEALVNAKAGVVSADARATFEEALKLDSNLPKAQFYLARAAEQDGDRDGAARRYATLIASSPADAPWLPLVRDRLAALGGPAADIAALPAPAQSEAIRGMVEGLSARLAAQGGSVEEWGRLIRARVVLGERDKALAALDEARRAHADKRAELDALVAPLGLENRP